MKKIILIAPPAAGKGTQAKLISKEYQIPHISSGQLLRDINDPKIKAIINSGKLLDDDSIYDIVCQRIAKDDCKDGYILDGFPRNYQQAKMLDSEKITHVVLIEINEKVALARMQNRVVCQKCQTVYDKISDKCQSCNGELTKRSDDQEEVFAKRLIAYQQLVNPLINYYQKQKILFKVDGSKSIEKVFEQIKKVLNE